MKPFGAMKRLWNFRSVNIRAKRELYEKIVVTTVVYGLEARSMRVEEQNKQDVIEMSCVVCVDY